MHPPRISKRACHLAMTAWMLLAAVMLVAPCSAETAPQALQRELEDLRAADTSAVTSLAELSQQLAQLRQQVVELARRLDASPADDPAQPPPAPSLSIDLSRVPATWSPGDAVPSVTAIKPDDADLVAGLWRGETQTWVPLHEIATAAVGPWLFVADIKRGQVVLHHAEQAIVIMATPAPPPATSPRWPDTTGWTTRKPADGVVRLATGQTLERTIVIGRIIIDARPNQTRNVTIRDVLVRVPNETVHGIFGFNVSGLQVERVSIEHPGKRFTNAHGMYLVDCNGAVRDVRSSGAPNNAFNVRSHTIGSGPLLFERCVGIEAGRLFGMKRQDVTPTPPPNRNVVLRDVLAYRFGRTTSSSWWDIDQPVSIEGSGSAQGTLAERICLIDSAATPPPNPSRIWLPIKLDADAAAVVRDCIVWNYGWNVPAGVASSPAGTGNRKLDGPALTLDIAASPASLIAEARRQMGL